ncbi:MAG: type IV secretion system protein VirB10 [Legionellales bacterium]|nr:type IV secretion system protein VirB10 [Legionellales bacterium]
MKKRTADHSTPSIAGARGAVNAKERVRQPGMKAFFWLILGGVLILGSIITWKAILRKPTQTDHKQDNTTMITNSLPPLALPFVPATQPSSALNTSGSFRESPMQNSSQAMDPLTERRLSGGFGEDTSNATVGTGTTGSMSKNELSTQSFGLAKQLQPLQLTSQTAGVLGDRDWLITRGTLIGCALQTRIDSDVSGMVVCYTTENVYSDNGRVILIDKGSKITGQYENGLQLGQARIFVAWQRLETPNGVIIDLNSPGTDPLGGAGIPGYVDEHFWQRFGSAIFLSVLQDAGQIASNLSTRANGNTTISFGNTSQATQDLASDELQRSISIKPTLYKHQGDRIAIYVARDLSFEAVYGLKTTSLKTHYPHPTLPASRKVSDCNNTCVLN